MEGFKSYRSETRENYGTIEGNLTLDQIQVGCLLRIADATEKMALNYAQLQADLEYFKRRNKEKDEEIAHLVRRITSLKGVITKEKKKLGKVVDPADYGRKLHEKFHEGGEMWTQQVGRVNRVQKIIIPDILKPEDLTFLSYAIHVPKITNISDALIVELQSDLEKSGMRVHCIGVDDMGYLSIEITERNTEPFGNIILNCLNRIQWGD